MAPNYTTGFSIKAKTSYTDMNLINNTLFPSIKKAVEYLPYRHWGVKKYGTAGTSHEDWVRSTVICEFSKTVPGEIIVTVAIESDVRLDNDVWNFNTTSLISAITKGGAKSSVAYWVSQVPGVTGVSIRTTEKNMPPGQADPGSDIMFPIGDIALGSSLVDMITEAYNVYKAADPTWKFRVRSMHVHGCSDLIENTNFVRLASVHAKSAINAGWDSTQNNELLTDLQYSLSQPIGWISEANQDIRYGSNLRYGNTDPSSYPYMRIMLNYDLNKHTSEYKYSMDLRTGPMVSLTDSSNGTVNTFTCSQDKSGVLLPYKGSWGEYYGFCYMFALAGLDLLGLDNYATGYWKITDVYNLGFVLSDPNRFQII